MPEVCLRSETIASYITYNSFSDGVYLTSTLSEKYQCLKNINTDQTDFVVMNILSVASESIRLCVRNKCTCLNKTVEDL